MKIIYGEGPDVITMGIAGQFQRGVPKDVDAEIGNVLLNKKTIIFKKVEDKKSTKTKEE